MSFSVDPYRDKPEVLRAFAKQWEAPPERWRFVTGQGVFNLAYDGFKLEARPAPEPQPGAEFIHSTRFTLVDGRGRMRGIYFYDYEKPELAGALVENIVRDTRALLETPERVVDHPHDARTFLVDRRGRLRGVYPADKDKELVRDARRLALTPDAMISVRSLPKLNAALNGTSFLFLSMGLAFILKKKVTAHKTCMTIALVASILFLLFYLAYHFQVGSVKYGGAGLMRSVYLGILLTHGARGRGGAACVDHGLAPGGTFDRHVAIARWTLPIWMYVSLTGILVYLLLYRLSWVARQPVHRLPPTRCVQVKNHASSRCVDDSGTRGPRSSRRVRSRPAVRSGRPSASSAGSSSRIDAMCCAGSLGCASAPAG